MYETHGHLPSAQDFIKRTDEVFAIPLPKYLKCIFDHLETLLNSDFSFDSEIKRTKNRDKLVVPELMTQTFQHMNRQQRLYYYMMFSDFAILLMHGKTEFPFKIKQDFEGEAHICYNNGKVWKRRQFSYDKVTHFLSITGSQESTTKKVNLAYYLFRQSKNEKYHALVLEAIDKRSDPKIRHIRIGFEDQQNLKSFICRISQPIKFKLWEFIKSLYYCDPLTKNSVNSLRKKSFEVQSSDLVLPDDFENDSDKENVNFFNVKQKENQKKYGKKDNILNENLESIEDLNGWNKVEGAEDELKRWSIYKNDENVLLKLVIELEEGFNCYIKYLQKPSQNISEYHKQDENILVVTKKYSKLCRPRYFIFRRKITDQSNADLFKICLQQQGFNPDSSLFSMQEPLKNYVKGSISVKAVFTKEKQSKNQQKIFIQIMMDHGGYLNEQQNYNMTLAYMKGIIQSLISHSDVSQKPGLKQIITKEYEQNSIVSNLMTVNQKNEIKVSPLFTKTQYELYPHFKQKEQVTYRERSHAILGQQWRRDEKVGGLVYLNEDRIKDQKNVIKFIFSRMGKNLFTGKSIFDISLPAHIFSAESNLERLLHSIRLAPHFIEQKIQKSPFQILSSAGMLAISTCLLYLSQEKSFNPILGQTSQMWIDGCPAYGEQISHHPPISSIFMVGRGYKIYGSLESKVDLHMNSGNGCNDGALTIEFQNGCRVINYLPSSQVSGLSFGQRKFKLIGKSHHIFMKQDRVLFMEIKYGNQGGNKFMGFGTDQSKPEDELMSSFFQFEEGLGDQQRKEELEYFMKEKKFKNKRRIRKIESLQSAEWEITGITSEVIRYKGSGQIVVDFSSLCPCSLRHDRMPLPSDSIWRQDIYWRGKQEIQESQKFKELLEEKQRADRKLRNN